MNARIEKKLSKRLLALAPSLFPDAWVLREPSELAYNQGSRITHTLHTGGGTDYWGDGVCAYSLWESWAINWPWCGLFEKHPEGHEREYFPNTEGFKPTPRNLLRLAAKIEARRRVGE